MAGCFPKTPPEPVADDCVADPLVDRERQGWRLIGRAREPRDRERARTNGAGVTETLEGGAPSRSPRQTARR
jgi:hypothetical protein